MTRSRKPAPATETGPQTATPTSANDTAALGQLAADKQLVGDASIWAALFDGQFRLAVKCDTCGRWLTSGDSKRAHRGPVCRSRLKAVAE